MHSFPERVLSSKRRDSSAPPSRVRAARRQPILTAAGDLADAMVKGRGARCLHGALPLDGPEAGAGAPIYLHWCVTSARVREPKWLPQTDSHPERSFGTQAIVCPLILRWAAGAYLVLGSPITGDIWRGSVQPNDAQVQRALRSRIAENSARGALL
jgi:hypothetical protein